MYLGMGGHGGASRRVKSLCRYKEGGADGRLILYHNDNGVRRCRIPCNNMMVVSLYI